MIMCRNITSFFKARIYTSFQNQGSLSRLKILSKTFTNEFKYFSTSVSNHSAAAVSLSYSTFQPEGQLVSEVPVIILHGLLGSKQNWRGIGKAICVKSKRKVYTLDARNHGESPHLIEFDYPLMSEDVKHFMDSQAISKAVVIGHSMGGRTAMHFALTNDNLVDKLIVVDVSPKKMPTQSKLIPGYMSVMKEAIMSIPKLGIVQARKEIDVYLSKTIPEEGIRQFLLTNLSEKNKVLEWKPNLDVLLEKFESGIMGFPSVSAHYQGETLFICGGDSPFVRSDDYPHIRTLFPKADFITIPGAGHWVHSEKPSEFLQAVYDFL